MSRRLPVYLLVDCSESMAGPAIEAVSQGIDSLVSQLRVIPEALETVHISLITFSRYAKQDVPLTEVMRFTPPKLSVRPGTALGSAINLLSDCIGREVAKTTPTVKGDYRPLVFLMTDGQPTDRWEEAADALRRRQPRIANLYAIGCGLDVDASVLRRLTDIVFQMPDMSPEKFRKLFVWLTASVQSASQRIETIGQEALGMESPPEGVTEAPVSSAPARGGPPRQVFLHARCSRSRKPYLMRYVRRPYEGCYEPVAAHPLAEFAEEDAGELPPVNSSILDGVPACPHCGNNSGGMCACGALFCTTSEDNGPVTCPKCNARLSFGGSGAFDITRSEG